jgi:uncharacterized protein YeaO (DUF488 family)
MIYTGYFAKTKSYVDKGLIPISIALKTPFDVFKLKEFAPTWDILKEYKDTKDVERYIERYNSEILGKLDITAIINKINTVASGKDVILMCYEKPGSFCHRHLVAEWLRENGFDCREY